MINILTSDILNQRKQNYIKLIQIKHKELKRIPRVSDIENDDRFAYIHSYLNSNKWNDLVYEALGISNGKGNQSYKYVDNKEKDEFIKLLKEELKELKNNNKKYINQTYFDKNRNKNLPCSQTYKKILNKSWKEIIEEFK